MKRRYYIVRGLLLLMAIGLFFLSPILKKYLVDHSEELIGKKLIVSGLHLDCQDMVLIANDVVLYEKNIVDRFIAFKSLKVNFSLWRLLRKEYSFSQISLVDPQSSIEQYKDGYNLSDLIPEDDTTTVIESENEDLVCFWLCNISISKGRICLYYQTVDNRISCTNLDFMLPLVAWDISCPEFV
jgi:uncharacterized protein involved in outer membrane biogenesis